MWNGTGGGGGGGGGAGGWQDWGQTQQQFQENIASAFFDLIFTKNLKDLLKVPKKLIYCEQRPDLQERIFLFHSSFFFFGLF